MYWIIDTNELKQLQETNKNLENIILRYKNIMADKESLINKKNNEIMQLKIYYKQLENRFERIAFEARQLVQEKECLQDLATLVDNLEKALQKSTSFDAISGHST